MAAIDVSDTIDAHVSKEFRRNGFAVLPRIADESEVVWLRQVYDLLFEKVAMPGAANVFDIAGQEGRAEPLLPQIVGPEQQVPELLESRHFARCRAIASSLLDTSSDDLDFYGHAILKPSGYGAATPWHQDEAYADPRWSRRGLSIWTTLDDATVESGCLHYLPGGHLGPVLDHRHIDDDDRIRGLETHEVDPTAGVACPLAPGGAVVHDFRTPHYAGPNRTEQARRAYVLVFMSPAIEVDDPEPRPWQNWA